MPLAKDTFLYCCTCDNPYGPANWHLTTRCLNCEHDICSNCWSESISNWTSSFDSHIPDPPEPVNSKKIGMPDLTKKPTTESDSGESAIGKHNVNLAAILNPGAHFSSLEDLEEKVIEKCGISRYILSNGI